MPKEFNKDVTNPKYPPKNDNFSNICNYHQKLNKSGGRRSEVAAWSCTFVTYIPNTYICNNIIYVRFTPCIITCITKR